MLKKNKIIYGILVTIAALLPVAFVYAQADFGINAVNNSINLAGGDPRAMVGRIIQIILSFLGVIILGLIIYAGFLWMTSNGEEDKISQAKTILKNATIGLAVTLSAWAITTFIISKLSGAISGVEGNPIQNSGNNLANSGFGAMGACSVDMVYPENSQNNVARNSSIIVSFKEVIGLDSVCVNASGTTCTCDNAACSLINPRAIRIFKSGLGDACTNSCPTPNTNVTDVSVSVSADKLTLVLSPLSYLGSESANTEYDIKLTNDFKKADGTSMFSTCSNDGFQWGFEVSTNLDLTPPQVMFNSLYPRPDNERDLINVDTPARNASAEISVNSCPQIYSPAGVLNVLPNAEVVLDYHGLINKFKVVVPAATPDKAQLFNGNTNALLGVADFDGQNTVVFDGYFSIKTTGHAAGDSWEITISPEKLADTLSVGNSVYIFAASSGNNNIVVPGTCDLGIQASNIQAQLSGNPAVIVNRSGNRVLLTAKVAGAAGNNLSLATSNINALGINAFAGGVDRQLNSQAKGSPDSPMNSIIKVNFNEAMNPLTLSGTASEVANYIQVVNASSTSKTDGAVCASNADCRSYRCDAYVCRGNYVSGSFRVSGNYRTVEFVSDNECGINGCGEKIYCLPANSNLAIEVKAANMKVCASDTDCAAYSPFKTCALNQLGYRSCQDVNGRNYPGANPLQLDGIIDAALNSLDGNRDTVVEGPISFFSDNFPSNKNNRDSYRNSFFINDKIETTPPKITSINPASSQNNIKLTEAIEITFNNLMMSSTLRSGGEIVDSGTSPVLHKFINLKSSEPTPLGFWLDNSDIDSLPLDGIADITVAKIKHSPFLESVTYDSQIGSGVKDIFQNCFKPSSGPNCEATPESPSCCFGVATSSLVNGNCQ
ncbi:MAG: Ig-like domain-containing protein [Candidatus Falkowbacteria bacterium]|nr:MAG: Ig-like domain-containing protein [Candidatus Falkowbacteria bacterium]